MGKVYGSSVALLLRFFCVVILSARARSAVKARGKGGGRVNAYGAMSDRILGCTNAGVGCRVGLFLPVGKAGGLVVCRR